DRARAGLAGARPHSGPPPRGGGGTCAPAALVRSVEPARAAGRRLGSVAVTVPDTPTGRLGDPATVEDLADVATRYDLIVISDEIYRDLVYEPAPAVASPVDFAPERTVVTTGLSKNLALGGWRIGVARLPDRPPGTPPGGRLLGIGSEIWSAAAGPVQEAAALAFGEPPELAERIARSRSLHETVCRAVADRFAAAGVIVPQPQAAFY